MIKTHPNKSLTRRGLLRTAVAGALMPAMPAFRVWGNEQEFYQGPLLITLQLDGGADVTQLCDPKVNTPGEPAINHWADTNDPGQAGNLLYAPIADNQRLFERFGLDTLVVNGVDSQTNSHETGRIYNWTGSNAEGKPSLAALHAAYQSPEQPLAYAVFGGVSRTAGIISYNRFDNLESLRTLALPGIDSWSGDRRRPEAEVAQAHAIVANDVSRLLAQPELSPRKRLSLARFTEARERRGNLEVLGDLIPPQDEVMREEEFDRGGGETFWSNLKQQMQSALLVCKSGLGSSADLSLGGFDTHDDHDVQHEALYTHLADTLDFFWDYAEELGLADRILLVIGSDFGRTNCYNDGNGKDHWPIGSYMIMEKNAPWGNRVVGLTDELHFAKGIDPQTLKEDPNGVYMTPAHVHKAIQQYMGFDLFAEDLGLGLNNAESLPLFDPFKATFG